MKKILCLLGVLLLVPAVALADDLSATLSGTGQGLAVLQTGNGQISYTIITSGLGTPTSAVVLQGNNPVLDLGATFSNGTAFGTVNADNGLISDMETNTGNYSVRVTSQFGNATGTLANAGDGGTIEPPPPSDCPDGFFEDPAYPDFCFQTVITAPGGGVQDSRREDTCIEETVCVSGAIPGRSELFIRVIGPRPNGFLWPTLVRFTPSEVEVNIFQKSSETLQSYTLDAVPPGDEALSGLQDREGFLPPQ